MTTLEELRQDLISGEADGKEYHTNGVSIGVDVTPQVNGCDETVISAVYDKYSYAVDFTWVSYFDKVLGEWYNTVDEIVAELEKFINDPLYYGFKNKDHTFTKFDDYFEDVIDTQKAYEDYQINIAVEQAIDSDGETQEISGQYGSIRAINDGYQTTIRYQGKDKTVSITVDNNDLVDDKDGIIRKVAEFFANY